MSITLQQYIQENPTATLSDAKLYFDTSQQMITSKSQAIYLDKTGLYLIVHEIAQGKHDTEEKDVDGKPTGNFINHAAKSTCLLIVNTLADSSSDNNDFNFMQGNVIGDAVIAKTEELRDVTLTKYASNIQLLLDICIAKCNVKTYPFSGVEQAVFDAAKAEVAIMSEEVLMLENSINSEVYTLTIGVDSPKKTSIKIMQKFGDNTDNLTPWHEVASFTNVHYKQQQYKAQIPACDCAYRELKVVSDYQLSMSIV